jgi:hypothetical protein
MTMFQLVEQGDAVSQEHGLYTSFPSLTRDPKTGHILLLYRQARYDETDGRRGMGAHGLDGDLMIRTFSSKTHHFGPVTRLKRGLDYPPGLMDGLMTVHEETLFLFIRSYPAKPTVYLAQGRSLDTLGHPKPFPSTSIYPLGGAQWGKMVSCPRTKRLLQVVYGGPFEMFAALAAGKIAEPATRPALFQSEDGGGTWTFCSWVSPLFLEPEVSANETALLEANGVLYVLMRTGGVYPGPLFMAISRDGGYTWSDPERTGLYGEAPMFQTLPDGRVLVCYRGFLPDTPETGGTFSIVEFDPVRERFKTPFTVETYHGNHYDGGYGDMLWLADSQQLLVTYYYSDKVTSRHPWLRYALLTV